MNRVVGLLSSTGNTVSVRICFILHASATRITFMDAGRAASSDIASCSTPPGAGVSPGNDASGIINFGGGDGGGRGGETSVQASGQVDICRKISSPENEAPVKKNGPQMDFGTSVARTHVLESGHPVAECTSVLSDSPLIPEWAFEEQESSEASGGTISGSEKSPLSYVDLQGLDENGRLIPTWREDVREYAAARRRPPCERSSSSDFEDMSSSAVVRTQELDTRSGSHVASAPLSSATSVLFGAARGTNLESDEQNEFCTREMMSGVEALSNVLDRNSSPLPQLNRLEAGASLSFSTDAHTRETTAERNASIDYSTTRMLSTSVEDNSGSISINPSPHARAGHVSAPPGVNDLAADRGGPSNVLNQDALQRAIRGICSDRSLTENERDSRRQALFSRSYESKDAERVRAICRRYASIAFMKTYSKHVDPETGLSLLGCDHYPRNCKLKAACCGLIVPCRLCHDDPQFSMGHNIDRFATKEVLCMICLTLQPVSSHCVNCNTQFARHFCAKCRFYDNTPGKDIYHCDQCGICRVGKGLGQDNFHCTNCNACVSLDSQTSHKCLAKSLEANCPICYVYLFTSTEPVVFMRCGHTMHSRCKY